MYVLLQKIRTGQNTFLLKGKLTGKNIVSVNSVLQFSRQFCRSKYQRRYSAQAEFYLLSNIIKFWVDILANKVSYRAGALVLLRSIILCLGLKMGPKQGIVAG